MRYLWLAAALVTVGCASAPIRRQVLPTLAAADARVLDGCYDCLLEAREAYLRIGVGNARPLIVARLFETQLLIALREKELGIDSALAFGRARELARELPVTAEPERYLALAEAVPPDPVSTPRRELAGYHREHAEFGRSVNDELQWLRTATALREPVRQYLAHAVDCGYLARGGRPGGLVTKGDLWTASLGKTDLVNASPLVAYRAATCDAIEPAALERLRTATPEFAETAMYLGRLEMQAVQQTGGRKARELFDEARDRFPDSIAINYLAGNLYQLAGDCRTAVGLYDHVIARKALHEDALLGRTTCLSFLRRHAEAIAQATQIIDAQLDNIGYAYHWRAWNHHVEKRLEPARADIEQAKRLVPRAAQEDTLTLAGMIEHDQDDLGPAEADLTRARALDRGRANCNARWYLGLVRIKQQRPADASTEFEDTMGCYGRRVADSERRLAAMEARTDLDADFRTAQIAGFRAAIKEDRSQQHAAAFNAASQAAQAANVPRARTFLELAAPDPELGDLVAQLRKILEDR